LEKLTHECHEELGEDTAIVESAQPSHHGHVHTALQLTIGALSGHLGDDLDKNQTCMSRLGRFTMRVKNVLSSE
jgi:hypothetical protein